MTQKELITKAEKQLNYISDMDEKTSYTDEWKRIGSNQLEMVFHLLDGDYENYDYWFNKFNH